jgi:hypothetical protein
MGKRREQSLAEFYWEMMVAELGIVGSNERRVKF